MENQKIIHNVPVTVDENKINEGAWEILKHIRPTWEKDQIEFQLLTDGITNKLVRCRLQVKDDTEEVSNTVLIRVYGNKTDLLIDRKAETRNILLLNSAGLAPSLFATFRNGLAYEYVPGVTLNEDTVTHPHIYKLVAKRMARLHKITVSGETPKPCMWTKTQSFIELVPEVFTDSSKQERFKDLNISKEKIQQEVDLLKNLLTNLNSPVVFCHNDLLLGNVIYTENKQCVTFIDFEYAAFNYQAYDIGNHFAEFVGTKDVDYSKYPGEKLQKDWIRSYLEEFKGSEITETEINTLYVQANQFALLSHLFWGIWALIQAEHSYLDFDFMEYAQIRLNEYFAKKDEFLSLPIQS